LNRGGGDPYLERGASPGTSATHLKARAEVIMAKTSPAEFINQVRAEARKVVWPSREETVRTALFVAIMMIILSVFFLGIDTLFGAIMRWLLSLA
jgi:preprotein translocase subunit SecE